MTIFLGDKVFSFMYVLWLYLYVANKTLNTCWTPNGEIRPILQMGILDNSVHREVLGVKRDELINTCTEFKILSLKPLINFPCYKAINVYCKQRIQIGRKK